jgi:glycosyltransferase involved in cell wall biosynthesis
MSSVSIIVSCFNQNRSVSEIIDRLETGSHTIQEVIVADDGSNPPLDISRTNSCSKRIHKYVFLTHENQGFRKCKILNQAIQESTSEYNVFLDGDCLPHKHFVKDHIAMAEKGYFVQGRRCFVREKNVKPLLDGKKSLVRLLITGKITGLLKSIRLPIPVIKRNSSMYGLLGCNLGIWRKDLLSINGFDEDYEGWGREDSDLGARLYNLGLQRKMVYGRSVVYHLNHPENSRGNLEINDLRLKKTIESKRIRCKNGIIKD